MPTGFLGHVLTGNHAGRPAASAVPLGALYACSTHSLIYQSNQSSWSTWATLTGSGLSDPMTTRGDIIRRGAAATERLALGAADTFLGSDGTDVVYGAVTDAKLSTSDITTNNASTSKHGFLKKLSNVATEYMDGTGAWSTPAGGGGGGGGVSTPSYVQKKNATNSASITLDSTPANGNSVILGVSGSNAAASAVSSTNTTWTKVGQHTTGGGQVVQIWAGLCAASAGTAITVTTGATFTQLAAVEVADALTPTAGDVLGENVLNVTSDNTRPIGVLDPTTPGSLVAIFCATGNAGNQPNFWPSVPHTPVSWATGVLLYLAYSPDSGPVSGQAGFVDVGAVLMVEIT